VKGAKAELLGIALKSIARKAIGEVLVDADTLRDDPCQGLEQ
jgi:hypothetical protein